MCVCGGGGGVNSKERICSPWSNLCPLREDLILEELATKHSKKSSPFVNNGHMCRSPCASTLIAIFEYSIFLKKHFTHICRR